LPGADEREMSARRRSNTRVEAKYQDVSAEASAHASASAADARRQQPLPPAAMISALRSVDEMS